MSDAKKLANFVKREIPDFCNYGSPPIQNHMGALIMDACIQAGLNYDRVVKPRVEEIERDPNLRTTTGVYQNMNKMEEVAVKNSAKIKCIQELTQFFSQEGIYTVGDLRKNYWSIRDKLLNIRNIGRKTRDYIGILAGVPDVVAIDRLLTQFAEKAGIHVGNPSDSASKYDRLFNIYRKAACLLGITPAELDNAVWRYMNKRKFCSNNKRFLKVCIVPKVGRSSLCVAGITGVVKCSISVKGFSVALGWYVSTEVLHLCVANVILLL